MKQRLCFRITAKLGNSKRQHCSRKEKIKNKVGTLFGEKKKKKKKKSLFFVRISIARALHMLRGLNVDAHFGKKAQ